MENLNILFTRNQESIPITTNSGKKDGSRLYSINYNV